WVLSGYALYVAPDSERGYDSDYNLLRATNEGKIAFWEDTPFNTLADWFYATAQDEHSLTADPQFVDPDGPDNRLGYDATSDGSPPDIVDDGDSNYEQTGNWTTLSGGYQGDHRLSNFFGDSSATYTFTGLTPGTYQLAATWTATENAHAYYDVKDGNFNIGTLDAAQDQPPSPIPFIEYNGTVFQALGVFYISGPPVTVRPSPQ